MSHTRRDKYHHSHSDHHHHSHGNHANSVKFFKDQPKTVQQEVTVNVTLEHAKEDSGLDSCLSGMVACFGKGMKGGA